MRIGNGAVTQRQTDVLGEVMYALDRARDAGVEADDNAWALQTVLLEGLARTWQEPDHGLWEIRGEPQRFTHSAVMSWVAFDRAVRAVELHGRPGPVEEWRAIRDTIRAEILEHGYDATRNTFTQHYATTEVDASLLVLGVVDFIDGDDPRMLGTIEAVEQDLMRNGLLLRYRTRTGVDGLAGDEHPFLACSFWLVEAYAGAGRTDDAHALFDRLVGLANDVGLLSEEYDPTYDGGRGRMVGNFPQAFSHLALVLAAFRLRRTVPPSLLEDPDLHPLDHRLGGLAAGVGDPHVVLAGLLEPAEVELHAPVVQRAQLVVTVEAHRHPASDGLAGRRERHLRSTGVLVVTRFGSTSITIVGFALTTPTVTVPVDGWLAASPE